MNVSGHLSDDSRFDHRHDHQMPRGSQVRSKPLRIHGPVEDFFCNVFEQGDAVRAKPSDVDHGCWLRTESRLPLGLATVCSAEVAYPEAFSGKQPLLAGYCLPLAKASATPPIHCDPARTDARRGRAGGAGSTRSATAAGAARGSEAANAKQREHDRRRLVYCHRAERDSHLLARALQVWRHRQVFPGH